MDDTFGRYLWCAATIEGNGVLVSHHLAHSQLLLPEERRFAGDVIYADEQGHQRRMVRMAEHFGPRPVLPSRWILRDRPDADILAAMNHSESLFLRCFGNVARVFSRFAPPAMLGEMEVIRAEETRHQAWGAAVLARLKAAGVVSRRPRARRDSLPEMIDTFRSLRRMA